MARYVKDLVLNKPEDFVTFIMNDYLQKNQFVVSEWKGEPAYRTGDALIEGYKYLKWSYENGTLHLEAWMKSTFGKEMGLDGFAVLCDRLRGDCHHPADLLEREDRVPEVCEPLGYAGGKYAWIDRFCASSGEDRG